MSIEISVGLQKISWESERSVCQAFPEWKIEDKQNNKDD